MSNDIQKISWVKFDANEWYIGTRELSLNEKGLYATLIALMYKELKPLKFDIKRLARSCYCSVRTFEKILTSLIELGKIIVTEDGHLWNTKVNEEINSCFDNLNKNTERAKQAAKARWGQNSKIATENLTHKPTSDDAQAMLKQCSSIANKNKNNIEKLNTTYLSKITPSHEATSLDNEDISSSVSDENNNIDRITGLAMDQNPNAPIIAKERSSVEKISNKANKTLAKTSNKASPIGDFSPDLDFAINQGLSLNKAKIEVEKFRNHWLSTGVSRKDWDAAWRNWILNTIEWKKDSPKKSSYSEILTAFGQEIINRGAEEDYFSNLGKNPHG